MVDLNLTVRPTRPGDVASLPAIERAAGERFRESPDLAWLADGEAPAGFSIDRDCELRALGEEKSVVRYVRHPLDNLEIRHHLEAGKSATRLALTWNARIAFMLTDLLQIRRIEFLDGVFEDDASVSKEERFDADAAIATAELRRLLLELAAPASRPAPQRR